MYFPVLDSGSILVISEHCSSSRAWEAHYTAPAETCAQLYLPPLSQVRKPSASSTDQRLRARWPSRVRCVGVDERSKRGPSVPRGRTEAAAAAAAAAASNIG